MTEPEEWPGLVKVTDLTIRELVESTDSTLARSLERILARLDDPNGLLSAFGSFAK